MEEFICCSCGKDGKDFTNDKSMENLILAENIFFNVQQLLGFQAKSSCWIIFRVFFDEHRLLQTYTHIHTQINMINKHVGAWICMIIKDIKMRFSMRRRLSWIDRCAMWPEGSIQIDLQFQLYHDMFFLYNFFLLIVNIFH